MAAVAEKPERPIGLLYVYTWDLLRALVGIIGAMTAFAGGIIVNGKEVALPLAAQIGSAVANVSYAGALIVVAVVLGRRQAWVRQAQRISLILAVPLTLVSLPAMGISDAPSLASAAFVIAMDVLAIYLMTGPAMDAWYTEPGSAPKYVNGAIVIWFALNAAFVAYAFVALR